jgi:hypothetical protein
MRAYNTANGKSEVLHQLATARVVRQSADAAFYLMQTLQIGAAQVLTFYDSGANGNLIDGSLAELLGLTVLDDTPATVTVVGGGSIAPSMAPTAASWGRTPQISTMNWNSRELSPSPSIH